MSKKPAKSDRLVDLPDWADDVTPADEVMRKFYAPTGTFQRGPIVPPGSEFVPGPTEETPSDTPTSPLPPDPSLITSSPHVAERIGEMPETEPAPPRASVSGSAHELPGQLETIGQSLSGEPSPASSPVADSTPPSQLSQTSESIELINHPPVPLPAAAASFKPVSSLPAPMPFEEFARKWRRYLYPGQLSVMRTLYDLTYGIGETECFTRYSEIAKLTKMTRRNSINVVSSLIDRGFVERLEVRNDSSGKGIRLRIHLDPAT